MKMSSRIHTSKSRQVRRTKSTGSGNDPKNPTREAHGNIRVNTLGEDFSLIKMNPATIDSPWNQNQKAKDAQSLPPWLKGTFLALEPGHPARRLLPISESPRHPDYQSPTIWQPETRVDPPSSSSSNTKISAHFLKPGSSINLGINPYLDVIAKSMITEEIHITPFTTPGPGSLITRPRSASSVNALVGLFSSPRTPLTFFSRANDFYDLPMHPHLLLDDRNSDPPLDGFEWPKNNDFGIQERRADFPPDQGHHARVRVSHSPKFELKSITPTTLDTKNLVDVDALGFQWTPFDRKGTSIDLLNTPRFIPTHHLGEGFKGFIGRTPTPDPDELPIPSTPEIFRYNIHNIIDYSMRPPLPPVVPIEQALGSFDRMHRACAKQTNVNNGSMASLNNPIGQSLGAFAPTPGIFISPLQNSEYFGDRLLGNLPSDPLGDYHSIEYYNPVSVINSCIILLAAETT